jgi:hypothetical protein
MDTTNAGEPQAGGQISGEASRNAAVKRLQKFGNANRSAGPNTGPTGIPKAGAGLKQEPGLPNYSPNPKKRL